LEWLLSEIGYRLPLGKGFVPVKAEKQRMIRRSGNRFADKIMRRFNELAREPADKSTQSAQA
jgi:hypothetical protein